ncbi:C40 family peptidase [Mucilaginibacter sp. KACC 22063]|uniref:C40 family peptidase n=1 Tax=Mucilaginibacter sp. KACC 22063 TaxID=3025666 RepID=UPI002364FC8F|nr:C40 family peptidase [Mucilaginibacter sp. KACC 22063]WDF53718.1 C40 family peptidase [Mucilaginibacter sp. KACC 22063]
MIKRLPRFAILFVATLLLFASCKSKKAVLKGSPGEVVKPQGFIAEKYAGIMGVDKDAIQNGRLYNFIEEWTGTPYRFGGLDKNGVDCSGLAYLLEQQVYGINIPRITSQQINVIKRKYEDELQEGDLVFFDFDGKKFSHVGIYLQNGYVVHASSRKGVMIIRLHDPSMYKYFSRAGSINLQTDASAMVTNPQEQ